MKRRNFIVAAGGSIAGVGVSGVVTGERSIEIHRYEGVRTHRFVPAGDEYRHERAFEQRDGALQSRHGTTTVSFADEFISEELFEAIRETSLESADRDDLAYSSRRDGGFEVRYRDTAVIDTFERFAKAEEQYRQELNAKSSFLIDFPTHVYDGDDPSSSGDLGERTGPINVGWDVGADADGVASQTASGVTDWTFFGSGTRYVIDSGGTIKGQDEDLGFNLWPYDLPNQYHARLYDVDSSTAPVVAQLHKDPVDHGTVTDPDWEFAESRAHMSSSSPWPDEHSVTSEYVGNDWPYDSTTNGYVDHVE